jgi:hypothetical protein
MIGLKSWMAWAWLFATAAALADDPPAPDPASAASAEPRVAAPDLAPAASAEPRVAAPAAVASTAAPSSPGRADARGKAPAPTAHDTLVLDPTAITGNRELPKVMVIVPWKKSEIGDLAGKPPNSLVDEILQPVDRDEFRREIQYHAVLSPDRPRNETAVTPAPAAPRPDR